MISVCLAETFAFQHQASNRILVCILVADFFIVTERHFQTIESHLTYLDVPVCEHTQHMAIAFPTHLPVAPQNHETVASLHFIPQWPVPHSRHTPRACCGAQHSALLRNVPRYSEMLYTSLSRNMIRDRFGHPAA